MKITISSSGGTLRTIPLANTLHHRGYLDHFFIPYHPQKNRFVSRLFGRKVKRDGSATNYIHTNVGIFFLRKLLMAKSWFGYAFLYQMHFLMSELFDLYVAYRLSAADILFTEILISLHTIRRAKNLGMITILDRGNTHIQYQTDLLREEYARLCLPYSWFGPSIIKKSLQEYEEADYISVLSTFAKKSFLEQGIPEHKLLLIPPGVDMTMFFPVQKQDNVFRIIYCGLICVKKGTHYLLNAVKNIGVPNIELYLIGEISHEFRGILEKYKGYFKHIGYVPRNKIHYYFSQGSIFVLPSLEEGFGKVVIEAMACGLPAIVTTNTCGEDVIRDGIDGFIVPIRDMEALKEKILLLYESEELRQKMGLSGQERVRAEFSEAAYAERFIRACQLVQERKKSDFKA